MNKGLEGQFGASLEFSERNGARQQRGVVAAATVLACIRLEAPTSARGAWYELRLLVAEEEGYLLTKSSGARSGLLDERSWYFTELTQAQRRFSALVAQKTNPVRQGRRYQVTG